MRTGRRIQVQGFFFLIFIYFVREREAEIDGERIPRRLYTVSAKPNTGLDLTNHEIMT